MPIGRQGGGIGRSDVAGLRLSREMKSRVGLVHSAMKIMKKKPAVLDGTGEHGRAEAASCDPAKGRLAVRHPSRPNHRHDGVELWAWWWRGEKKLVA